MKSEHTPVMPGAIGLGLVLGIIILLTAPHIEQPYITKIIVSIVLGILALLMFWGQIVGDE